MSLAGVEKMVLADRWEMTQIYAQLSSHGKMLSESYIRLTVTVAEVKDSGRTDGLRKALAPPAPSIVP